MFVASLNDAEFLCHTFIDRGVDAETILLAYDMLCQQRGDMEGCRVVLALVREADG
jgi:hypothetical protein